MFLPNQTGSIVSFNPNDKDINTDYYDEIVKGNFGLKWPVMHYIARLLNEAGVRELICGAFTTASSSHLRQPTARISCNCSIIV